MQSPDHSRFLEDLATKLGERRQHIWVAGGHGAEHDALLPELHKRFDTLELEVLPSTEDDAGTAAALLAHALLQGRLSPGSRALDERGFPSASLCSSLASLDKVLVVRLQSGVGLRSHRAAQQRDTPPGDKSRLEAMKGALRDVPRVIWLAEQGVSSPQSFANSSALLPLSLVERVALEVWGEGSWAESCRQLQRSLRAGDWASPVVWRLAVGAVYLGGSSDQIASQVVRSQQQAVDFLVGEVLERLPEDARRSFQEALHRLAVLRRALPLDQQGWIQPPEPYAQLFWEAFTQGQGSPPRLHPQVVAELEKRGSFGWRSRYVNQFEAAKRWEMLDGAQDPSGLGPAATRAWSEKVHHLALSGEHGAALWSAQVKPSPELYWVRGRELSAQRQYEAAAEVYASCLNAFPDDDYAHHYFAYNKAKSGDAPQAREHYALACRLRPDNVWWQSRRITQLIETRRWVEASRAWREACNQLDGVGEERAWVAAHLHYWVAEAWEKAGPWYEAASILRSLGDIWEEVCAERAGFAGLKERVEVARVEAEQALQAFLDKHATDEGWEGLRDVWNTFCAAVPELSPPSIRWGEDGPVLDWSNPGVGLEIEVDAGKLQWGAHDRLYNRSGWGESELEPLSDDLRWWLTRVVRHD